MRTMSGRMYRIIDDEPVEFIKWGDEILAVTDPRTQQCIGQLVLELTYEEANG